MCVHLVKGQLVFNGLDSKLVFSIFAFQLVQLQSFLQKALRRNVNHAFVNTFTITCCHVLKHECMTMSAWPLLGNDMPC